ncbi:MAG: MBL fold metallo-hydrolase [Actinocatenispora sp.]
MSTPAASVPTDGTGPDDARLCEVRDGVLAWVQPDGSWWVNNAGAVTGPDGTLVIDTCATETRTRRFLAALRQASGDVPVRYAVSTHLHGDHTHGNCLLPASTVLIAHEETARAVMLDPIIDGCPPLWSPLPDWGDVTRRRADLTFTTDLALTLGGRRIELRHPGHTAHTPGDVVAWLPDERVLFTGDLLFHGLTPLVGMGSVDGALRALGWLDAFGAEAVVPGHGPLCTADDLPAILAAQERYYRFVLETAEAGRRDAVPPLAAARRCDLGEFADWADAERLVFNLHRAYADAAGEPCDIGRAIVETAEFAGGQMHTHV